MDERRDHLLVMKDDERPPSPGGDERFCPLPKRPTSPLRFTAWFWRLLKSQRVLVLSAAVLVIVIDRSTLLCVRLSDSIKFYCRPKP